MIDKIIKNTKKILYKVLERILTAKILEKKILYKVLERILTAIIANTKKFFFLSFPYIKGVNIKYGSNIS